MWVVLVLVFVLGLEGLGEGCWEQEKLSLLQLKPFFNLQYDVFGNNKQYVLYNWVEEEGKKSTSDCCQWERVECNATTGRVIGLSLANRLRVETFPYNRKYKPKLNRLNASFFLPFEELKSLSLSGNHIVGCLDNEGFEKLALKLKNLEVLDLSINHFNDSSILSSLVQFSSLKFLNLSHNLLSGAIHTNGFGGLSTKLIRAVEILDLSFNCLDNEFLLLLIELSSLKYLDLSYNWMIGSNHTNGFKGLSRLRNLETLYLSGNILENNILSYLGNLSSLKVLGLKNCELKGTIDMQELNNLVSLKELYLNDNEIKSFGSFHDKDDERQSGLINLEVLDLTLNILNNSLLSSFGPFSKSLKHLHIIAGEELIGSIDIKDARGLKNLKGLDRVAVVAADNGVLLESLGLFPSLKTLHFESGLTVGTVNIQELRNLTNLEELYLDNTFLHSDFLEDAGKLTSLRVLSLIGCTSTGGLSIQGPLHLKNLESLNMDETSLQNSFLEKIGATTSLKILSLSTCGLSGTLSTQGICQLTSLEKLNIRENKLRGTLPSCFSNLTFLRHLDFSSNQFSGNLAVSPLQRLTSMEYIDLSNNQFQIPSSLEPFFNHSKLKYFYGYNNNIFAEAGLHSLAPRFQLNIISLSCCGDAGPLPKFLHHQQELQTVDLSNVNLRGEFPSWLLENNTKLEKLALGNNSLSGHLPLPFHSAMKLLELDVSNNFFDGHIPVEIGVYLPGLMSLNISKNSLDGSIPTSISDMKLLEKLDLSNNRLSGVIPESLAMSCSSLNVLVLSNNNLRGQIFSANFNLTDLRQLELAGNNFTGSIPNSLSNCPFLLKIDIGHNHLSGAIPRWMGNLSYLIEVIIPDNHIEGPIPKEFCGLHILGVLDLSMNNISGTIPSCFNRSLINHVHLSKNRLRGPIPNRICKSPRLVTLDLSDNQFTGNIPNCIEKLVGLSYLVLRHNNLEGEIPNQLCQLRRLSVIDLSHNNLSGRIPNCLNVTAYEEVPRDYYTTYYIPYGLTDGSIDLTTKSISYSYRGRILRYLCGIDLSANKLTGEIPHNLGNLHKMVMLNLSHNCLTGQIPPSLSNLSEIESLDLSYNNLSGNIPLRFVELYSLAYFNVSYNNLSGNPPPRTAQFASDFDENSYWGNPFLCGKPLPRNCSTAEPSPMTPSGKHVGLIDIESFYMTFTASYIMVLLTIAAVLYINPHWRRAWFYLIEIGINSCLYFIVDNLPKQFRCGNI